MPLSLGNLLGARNAVPGAINKKQAAIPACSCPACTGLQCLDRPSFFAGQLISETDLNSEISYMLAKQRLHNRYLHGVGTVCGLEVVCSNCDGQVLVNPGYAIDPCGNDIIVCQQQSFDVLKAIQACCTAMKKKNTTGCDPYQPVNTGCTDQEQRWCITIAYQETPSQPITPLRTATKCSCKGSCGCTGGCGCSKGSTSTQTNGCTAPAPTTATAATACQPTRVIEGYQLGIVPDSGTGLTSESLLQGTLLGNILGCLTTLLNLGSKFNAATTQVISAAFGKSLPQSDISNNDAYLACCQFRQYAIDLFTDSTFATRCTALKTFDALPCPQPPNREQQLFLREGSDSEYLQTVQDTIDATLLMLFEYFRECVCHSLLPSCPPDPGDDRLILACVTIKDGKITEICNFGCRQFAGSFPSFFYWLSLIPLVPLLKNLIDDICCSPAFLARNSPLVNNLAKLDPAGLLQSAITDGNFALPRMLVDRLGDIIQRFSLQGAVGSIPTNSLNLATLRGMSTENAESALKQFGISAQIQQVNSRGDIPLVPPAVNSLADLAPFAQRGDHAILYVSGGNVMEVQRSAPTQANNQADAQPNADVLEMRKQIAALQADIATLKAAAPGHQ
jgi:hypothetical protein